MIDAAPLTGLIENDATPMPVFAGTLTVKQAALAVPIVKEGTIGVFFQQSSMVTVVVVTAPA